MIAPPAASEEIPQDELPKAGRRGIIAVLLVQWLALLINIHGDDFGLRILAGPWEQTVFLTLVLAVPGSLALCLTDWRDRRVWLWTVLLAVLTSIMSAATGYRVSGNQGLFSVGNLFPYGASVVVLVFVMTPFAQCRLLPALTVGSASFPYPDLFRHAWNNVLTLVIAGIFTGLFWAVVALACGLFAVIGIGVVGEIVFSTLFIMPVTGLVLGVGVIAGRTQHRAVLNLRRIMLAILQGLLPIVAIIAVVFIAALPLTGLEPLWRTGKAGLLLMALMLAIIVFVNGVFQDGGVNCPYGRFVRRLVELALLTLPVYGALTAYGLYLRVEQYGWSGERFWASLACLILSLYAVGYAFAAAGEWLRRDRAGNMPRGWLAPMGPHNVAVAALLLLFLFAVQLPWINPDAVTVRSQLRRLTETAANFSREDIHFLRFQAGRDGVEALTTLKMHPKFAGNATVVADIEKALTATEPYGLNDSLQDRFPPTGPITTLQQVQDNLVIFPEGSILPAGFLKLFLPVPTAQPGPIPRLKYCIENTRRCAVIVGDLNRDGRTDYTVFDLSNVSDITLFADTGDGWKKVAEGRIQHPGKWGRELAESVLLDLQKGHFAPQQPHFDMLTIGGREIIFIP